RVRDLRFLYHKGSKTQSYDLRAFLTCWLRLFRAVANKGGETSKQITSGSQGGERLFGCIDQFVGQRPCALEATKGDKRGFALIQACVLADGFCVSGCIQNVIGDLKRESKIFGKVQNGLVFRTTGTCVRSPHFGAGNEERTRFVAVNRLQGLQVDLFT